MSSVTNVTDCDTLIELELEIYKLIFDINPVSAVDVQSDKVVHISNFFVKGIQFLRRIVEHAFILEQFVKFPIYTCRYPVFTGDKANSIDHARNPTGMFS